jgi:hypothetical protein
MAGQDVAGGAADGAEVGEVEVDQFERRPVEFALELVTSTART